MIINIEESFTNPNFADAVTEPLKHCDCNDNGLCDFCTALHCPLCEESMSLDGFDENGIYVAYCNSSEKCKLFEFRLPLEAIAEISAKVRNKNNGKISNQNSNV